MDENADRSQPEFSPNPAESIEVDEEVKEDELGDGVGDGVGGMSRELYKEMRAICDALTNHRISIKGDEWVECTFALDIADLCAQRLLPFCPFPPHT